jgi:hypothetical protein
MPQCSLLDMRSTQIVRMPMPISSITSQALSPLGHAETQDPPLHISSVAHIVPHAPQLPLSVMVSVHAAPQRSCPDGHISGWQAPSMQLSPTSQALPQRPQCSSLVSSMQPAPQSSWPAGQVIAVWHMPELQVSSAAHALPHAPQ